MTKSIIVLILTAMASIAMSVGSYAQSKPRWVSKGVKALNEQRSNDTYTFVSLNTHDPDLTKLQQDRVEALKKYVSETYGALPFSIESTEYSRDPIIYQLSYLGPDSTKYKIVARLVDEYDEFDDFELNVFQFEFYQLYAVSKPNVTPIFDDFSITKQYTLAKRSLGLIPGMSQIYKCQETKGYVIIGAEVFFTGAALYFDKERRHSKKMKGEEFWFAGSWASKERAWRTFEYGSIICAGAVYIYNLIDAFKSKGAPQVVVKKNPAAASYTLAPFLSPQDIGVSFVLNF